MWHLRDYNDELLIGRRVFNPKVNNLEKAIVEGLEATEHLALGTNPTNESIFRKLLGMDAPLRDLIVNFQKSLPPSEKEKFAMMGRAPVSLAIPAHLQEMAAAVSAYYTNRPEVIKQYVLVTRKRYLESLNTPERLAKHKALREKLLQNDAKLAPWFSIPKSALPKKAKAPLYQNSFNPALMFFLEFFFDPAQFEGRPDTDYFGMMVSEHGRRGQIAKLLCNQIFTFSIPNDNALRYMVDHSNNKRIAEIGAGSGYWANLLTRHGADVVANDNNSEGGARYFPVVNMDAEKYVVENGGFADRSLFMCWPRGECLGNETVCMPERTLPQFKGKDLFFIGEIENGCTFDMDAWVKKTPAQGWKPVTIIDIPNFLGTDDKLYHFHRD